MKKLLVIVAALAALALPVVAQAHPLGNFTTNRYTEVVASGKQIYVLYVLDLAEIPTFQTRDEVSRLGNDGYAEKLGRQLGNGLALTVGGSPRALTPLRHAIAFPNGVGGLHTTRLEVVYSAGAGSTGTVTVRDGNFPDRIGWREIVVRADNGARIASSSAPAASVSDHLRAYPKNRLRSALDVTSATASVVPGTAAGVPPALFDGKELSAPVTVRKYDGSFTSLIGRHDLSFGFVLVALLIAAFWGAVHALSPGHGKSIVAAYLVGSRGKARHAFALGGIVTVTHTIGVFTLGLITLALSQFLVPETLYPWLNLVSALTVVAVGVAVLRSRALAWIRPKPVHGHHHHDHGQPHDHDHSHDHGHSHVPQEGTGWRGIFAVGVSGGILPCPSALVVLLAAISLHRVAFGLVLILAFSFGLAATVSGIGLVAIGARRAFSRMSFEGRFVRALPALSALVIFSLGLVMTFRAFPQVL
jgi:nickel/cobalt exporter